VDEVDSENQVMTYPFKKRINTELFIDGKHGAGLHIKGRIKKFSDFTEESKLKRRKSKAGM